MCTGFEYASIVAVAGYWLAHDFQFPDVYPPITATRVYTKLQELKKTYVVCVVLHGVSDIYVYRNITTILYSDVRQRGEKELTTLKII